MKATNPTYIPNRGLPEYDCGSDQEKYRFQKFCEANPHLVCRSQDPRIPANLGGLLITNALSRHGYRDSDKWNGTRDFVFALDHTEYFYQKERRRWVMVGLPNCYGAPCECVNELDRCIERVNLLHGQSRVRSKGEYLVRHISPPNHSWYTPGSGKVIIAVASNVVPVYF